MKIAFEGDPTEIVSFIHQLPGSGLTIAPTSTSLLTDLADQIEPDTEYARGKRDGILAAIEAIRATLLGSAAPEVIAEALMEPAPIMVPSPIINEPAPAPEASMPALTADGRQPALKDQITHFLERRGRAKLGEIAKGVGLPNAKVSPRLAELCAGGFVLRAPAKNDKRGLHTEYEFGRNYVASGRVRAPKAEEPVKTEALSEPAPAPVPAPVATTPVESTFTPERAKTLKETILNFLIEYGEPASIKEIAEYLSFELQAVRSRLSELNKMGLVQRHESEAGAVSYAALKTWAGEPLPPTEQPAEVPSEQPAPAPEPEKPVMPSEPEAEHKKKRQPNMKMAVTDIIADFGGRAATKDIIARMHGVRGKTVSARLAELKHDGVVERHFDPVTRQSEWELLRPYSHEQKIKMTQPRAEPAQAELPMESAKVSEPLTGINEEHTDQLKIMGALADTAEASYYDLERIVGLDRTVLSKRIAQLEKDGLVEREGHNPTRFIGRPPTRKNQKPLPSNSLNEAVIAAVREHPGQTSAQLAIRMMKSWSEVARRLHDLEKTVVECRITDKERYYIR